MGVKTRTLPEGIGLIEVHGSLLAEPEVSELRHAIEALINRGERRVLIDFTGATYMNSSAMGVLVSAHTSYSRREWQLKLCSLNNTINAVFVITKLNTVFDISDTREEAIRGLASEQHH